MPFDNHDEYKKIPVSRKSRERKREMKEGRKEEESGLSLTAGWQRLNDLPNNKSSGRYDRMQRGPSLGTREPLTSPYLSAKASTCSIPFRRFDPPPSKVLRKHCPFPIDRYSLIFLNNNFAQKSIFPPRSSPLIIYSKILYFISHCLLLLTDGNDK